MGKTPKKVNKYLFLWNNFRKSGRGREEGLGKISHFLGKVDFIIKVENAPKNFHFCGIFSKNV